MAIAFGRVASFTDGNNTTTTSRTSPLAITVTINAGETAVLVWASSQRSTTNTDFSPVSSITGGGTWTRRVTAVPNSYLQVEIWSTGAGAASAATSISVAFSPTDCDCIAANVLVYTGVAAIGLTNTNSGTSNLAATTITTQDTNNFVVGGFVSDTANTNSANTGTLRNSTGISPFSAGHNEAVTGMDNTAASASAVAVKANLVASLLWASAGLELRSVAGGTLTDDDAGWMPKPWQADPIVSVW